MSGVTVIRVILGTIGALMLLAGVMLAVGGASGGVFIPALWLIVPGAFLVIIAVIEVNRYRSEAAERDRVPPGPGGGERVAPEPRFQPTDEIFIDPATRRLMRVFTDPVTGERRYVAEG